MSRGWHSFAIGTFLAGLACGLTGWMLGRTPGPSEGPPPVWQVLHYWLSGVTLFSSALAITGGVLIGQYRQSSRLWFGLLLVFGSAFLGQVTGNLLPMDRHDVQTVAIEIQIARQLPWIGDDLAQTLQGGAVFDQSTVTGWAALHPWLAAILLALGGVLMLSARPAFVGRARSSLLLLPTALAVGLAFLRGHAVDPAVPADYSSFDARPSWYTLPLHGLLRMFAEIDRKSVV